MGYWFETAPPAAARLAELAQIFRDCRQAFFETADLHHWAPEPGSGAARAARDLPSPDPAVANPRGETGHRLITEIIQTYLLTASFHLGALASLYEDGEVLFSAPPLIRSVIENCSRAVWVLGDDADEPSDARLARAYLEELLSVEEEKKNIGRLRGETHPTYERARTAFRAVQREIKERFPGTAPQDLGGRAPTLNGQTRPGLEAGVVWMYKLTESYGGTIGDDAALGIYGVLSNMTHPTLYPARQRRQWFDDPAAGRAVAYLQVDLDSRENEARVALAAFYNALNYVGTYFGWPAAVIDNLTAKIEAKLPTFFL